MLPTVFDVDKLREEIVYKREESLKPEVYTNPNLSSKLNKDLKVMESKVDMLDKLETRVKDLCEYIELCELEGEESMVGDIDSGLASLEVDITELYLATLLSGEYDNNNAIVKIHSGAGGTESCDWASMLYRMYTRWCEKNDKK